MRPEVPTPERPHIVRRRSKVGLETPLAGRLVRETRLVFAPPVWYDALTYGCLGVGGFLFVMGMAGVPVLIFGSPVLVWLGPLVFLSGLWGQLSSERMTCDLRAGIYARREGQGLFKRLTRGRLSDLDAVVLMAEQVPGVVLDGRTVTYRLVLHWRGAAEPFLVCGSETRVLPRAAPLNAMAGGLAERGARYAGLLGIAFYDNSYFHMAEPLRPV